MVCVDNKRRTCKPSFATRPAAQKSIVIKCEHIVSINEAPMGSHSNHKRILDCVLVMVIVVVVLLVVVIVVVVVVVVVIVIVLLVVVVVVILIAVLLLFVVIVVIVVILGRVVCTVVMWSSCRYSYCCCDLHIDAVTVECVWEEKEKTPE